MRSLLLLWAAMGAHATMPWSSPPSEPPPPGPGTFHLELKIYLINSKYDFCRYCINWCLDSHPPATRLLGVPDLVFRPGISATECPFDCDDHLFHYLQSQTQRWLTDNYHRAPNNHPLRATKREYTQYGKKFAELQRCSPEGGSRSPKNPLDPSSGSTKRIDWDAEWTKVQQKLNMEHRGTSDKFYPDDNPWEGWVWRMDPNKISNQHPSKAEDSKVIPVIGRPGGGGNGGDGSGGNGKNEERPGTPSEKNTGDIVNKPQKSPDTREPVGAGGRGTGNHRLLSRPNHAQIPQSIMGIPLRSLASGLTSQLSNLQAGLKQQGANLQAMNRWTDCMVTCLGRAITGTPDQVINIFQSCSVPNGCDGRTISRYVPEDHEAVVILRQVLAQSGQQIRSMREHHGDQAAAATLLAVFMLIAFRRVPVRTF